MRYGMAVEPGAVGAPSARVWPTVARRPATLLHDDYHPGNVLWSRGRLTSVVDWTGAGFGDPVVRHLLPAPRRVAGVRARGRRRGAGGLRGGHGRGRCPTARSGTSLAASRAKGAERLVVGQLRRLGLPVTLAEVEDRCDRFIRRALADLG